MAQSLLPRANTGPGLGKPTNPILQPAIYPRELQPLGVQELRCFAVPWAKPKGSFGSAPFKGRWAARNAEPARGGMQEPRCPVWESASAAVAREQMSAVQRGSSCLNNSKPLILPNPLNLQSKRAGGGTVWRREALQMEEVALQVPRNLQSNLLRAARVQGKEEGEMWTGSEQGLGCQRLCIS